MASFRITNELLHAAMLRRI